MATCESCERAAFERAARELDFAASLDRIADDIEAGADDMPEVLRFAASQARDGVAQWEQLHNNGLEAN